MNTEFWAGLWASQGSYLPHAVCLDYGPLIYLHAAADGLIAASYYSIPFALMTFAWKRHDLEFRWIFVMFGVFILACGTTHVMDIVTLAEPEYLLAAAVKVVTAIASVVTAVALWPLLHKALSLPGPQELSRMNATLAREVAERQAVEEMVRGANADLEERVRERTHELELANEALRSEILHRIAMERALQQAKDEAEESNIGKSRFLAAASHDLRQPIQAMFYFTQALAFRIEDERGRIILNDLERSLGALKGLLDSLLDFSKLEAGVVVPEKGCFPIADLLSRAAAEFTQMAAEKGVELRVVGSSHWVQSDPGLLGRVLQNLVANAVRYTPTGRVVVGCRRYGKTLKIQVLDSGVGIPEDRLTEIFDEFSRLDKTIQGLGLGLAIVRRLCALLNHKINVCSHPGRGSAFTVELPIAPLT